MIHINIDDTIVDIIDKMQKSEHDTLILDFPLGHPILHNYISLKILKTKAWKKHLVIATSDKIWKKIWQQIWIEYSLVKNSSFIENSSKHNLLSHNYTFWEYLKFQITSYKSEFLSFLKTHKKIHTIWKYSRNSYEKISVSMFIVWLISSTFLFVFIYLFAISKSYIELKPEILIKKQAHNFVFVEEIPSSVLWNNKYIKVENFSKTLFSSDTFAATQILESNNIASWTVTVSNWLEIPQTLIPNTRFISPSWLVFRSTSWVNIPAWVLDNFGNITPGSAVVKVTADSKDTKWNFSWSAWNIKQW